MELNLDASGRYADNRMMKRRWTATSRRDVLVPRGGRALNRATPHEAGIWTFEDLGSRRPARPNSRRANARWRRR